MVREVEMRKAFFSEDQFIETIYFGGGTPSLLTIEEIEQLVLAVKQHFRVVNDVEITLEANPEDLAGTTGKAFLQELFAIGINRLSIGVQSFHQHHLDWMNRVHAVEQTYEAINNSRSVGFNSFTVDLIYGIPGLTTQEWDYNISELLSLKVDHFSAYCLTVEPKTALHKWVENDKVQLPTDEDIISQLSSLENKAKKAGYKRYEISNFSLPGKESKHNTAYWQNKPYLGIGPSAHAYDGLFRYWNVSNNAKYLKGVEAGVLEFEKEKITPLIAYNEFVLTRLRLQEGFRIEELNKIAEFNFLKIFQPRISELVNEKKLVLTENSVRLTDKGRNYADGIAAEFMLDQEEWNNLI